MNLYVGNLLFDVTENELKSLFEPFGQVTEIRLIMDKYSGKSKGFGFIEMPSKEEAEKATNIAKVSTDNYKYKLIYQNGKWTVSEAQKYDSILNKWFKLSTKDIYEELKCKYDSH